MTCANKGAGGGVHPQCAIMRAGTLMVDISRVYMPSRRVSCGVSAHALLLDASAVCNQCVCVCVYVVVVVVVVIIVVVIIIIVVVVVVVRVAVVDEHVFMWRRLYNMRVTHDSTVSVAVQEFQNVC
jgi:hypothetical protein